MRPNVKIDSVAALRTVLQPFCKKDGIRRLEVFGSAARGDATPDSDVDLLVTFGEGEAVPTAALLESPNRFAREQILGSVVSVYGT